MIRHDTLGLGGGTSHEAPLIVRQRPGALTQDQECEPLFQNWLNDFTLHDDFLYDSVSDATGTSALNLFASTGTPAVSILANTTGGVLKVLLEATSAEQSAFVSQGDQLNFDASKPLFCAWRAQIPTLTSVQTAIWGFGSAASATLSSIARHAFLICTGDNVLKYQALDSTPTTTSATSTGITLTASTYYWFCILKDSALNLHFFLLDADGTNRRRLATVTGVTWSGNVQPLGGIKKASGTTVPFVTIDTLIMRGTRSY
jgi:hypothetical protein